MKKILKVIFCILLPITGLSVGVYLAHAKIEEEKRLMEMLQIAKETQMKDDARDFLEIIKRAVSGLEEVSEIDSETDSEIDSEIDSETYSETDEYEEPMYYEPDWAAYVMYDHDFLEKCATIRQQYVEDDFLKFREIFENLLIEEDEPLNESLKNIVIEMLSDETYDG